MTSYLLPSELGPASEVVASASIAGLEPWGLLVIAVAPYVILGVIGGGLVRTVKRGRRAKVEGLLEEIGGRGSGELEVGPRGHPLVETDPGFGRTERWRGDPPEGPGVPSAL